VIKGLPFLHPRLVRGLRPRLPHLGRGEVRTPRAKSEESKDGRADNMTKGHFCHLTSAVDPALAPSSPISDVAKSELQGHQEGGI
jgi:hypothetical protein